MCHSPYQFISSARKKKKKHLYRPLNSQPFQPAMRGGKKLKWIHSEDFLRISSRMDADEQHKGAENSLQADSGRQGHPVCGAALPRRILAAHKACSSCSSAQPPRSLPKPRHLILRVGSVSLLGAVNSCLNTSPCPWDGHVTPHPSSRCPTSLSLQGTGQQQRKRFAGSSTEVSGFRRAGSVRFACSSSLRGSTRSSLHCRCSSEMERSCECREELRDASVAAAEQCCSAHTQLGTAHHSWVLAQAGDGPQPRTSHGHPCIGSWVQAGYRLASLQGAWKSPQGSLQQHMSVCTAESARSLYDRSNPNKH